jgi:hypothetical protein
MNRFIKKSIIFLPLLAVAYLFILFVIVITPLKNFIPNIKNNTGGPGQSLLRFREAQKIKNIDILFVGSSHTSKGFDNRIFAERNIRTFNLGSGLQTPQNSYYLLKEYVPSIVPKKIIMELYWDVFEYENGNEACIDITSNCPLSMEIVKMNFSTKEFKSINSMIANYLSRSLKPLAAYKQEKLSTETYVSGGYLEGTHLDSYTSNSIAAIKPHVVIIQKRQLNYLKDIIEYCYARAIPLLFVTAPVPKELLNSISNYDATIETIKNVIQPSQQPWINFNDPYYRDQLQLNSITDFDDANHLSQTGVIKFNTLLIDVLKKQP